MRKQRTKGFTLIELLVVIAIIGILSAIVLASLNTARLKGNDAAREARIHSIQTALELYYTANGLYPVSGGASSPNSGWTSSNDNSWLTLQTALEPYIAELPIDPAQSASGWAGGGSNAFSYYSSSGGCARGWYMIVYHLQGSTRPNQRGVTTCSGTTYNYGGSGTNVNQVVTVGMNGSGH